MINWTEHACPQCGTVDRYTPGITIPPEKLCRRCLPPERVAAKEARAMATSALLEELVREWASDEVSWRMDPVKKRALTAELDRRLPMPAEEFLPITGGQGGR